MVRADDGLFSLLAGLAFFLCIRWAFLLDVGFSSSNFQNPIISLNSYLKNWVNFRIAIEVLF